MRQSSDDDINYNNPQTIKDYYGLINIFLQGINIQTFFPNALSCSQSSYVFLQAVNKTVLGLNPLNASNQTGNALLDQIKVYSSLVSVQFADTYLKCHLTGVDAYDYVTNQAKLYNGSWSDWIQAGLQNMVGNILRFNNIYNRIVIASETNDQK